MLLLPTVLLTLLSVSLLVGAQNTYLYFAEAEASVVCYTRYPEAMAIWNSLMLYLPSRHMIDAALLGRDLTLLRALLRAGVRPCEAVGRVLLQASHSPDLVARHAAQCSLGRERLPVDSPALSCLHGAHLVGLVASLQAPSVVETRALLLQAASAEGALSGEATISYDGTYATNFTRAVVAAAVEGEERRRRKKRWLEGMMK